MTAGDRCPGFLLACSCSNTAHEGARWFARSTLNRWACCPQDRGFAGTVSEIDSWAGCRSRSLRYPALPGNVDWRKLPPRWSWWNYHLDRCRPSSCNEPDCCSSTLSIDWWTVPIPTNRRKMFFFFFFSARDYRVYIIIHMYNNYYIYVLYICIIIYMYFKTRETLHI